MRALRALTPAIVLLAILVGLIHAGHRHTEAWAPRARAADEIRFLPSGKALSLAALGYEQLLADLLWTRAVLMFGENFGEGGDNDWYTWLYHMMDLATDLDPGFKAAYKYGGTMLRVDGVFVDQSSILFSKGSHNMPNEWYFPFGIAMNYFIVKENRVLAAKYMRRAASLPDGPFYLRNLAASLLDETQGLENALAFLVEELRVVPEGNARKAIEVKIFETKYQIGVRDAEEVIATYRRTTGALPRQPGDVGAAVLTLPPDPLGGTWVWSDDLEAPPGSLRSTAYYDVFSKLSQETGLGPFQPQLMNDAVGPVGVVPDRFDETEDEEDDSSDEDD